MGLYSQIMSSKVIQTLIVSLLVALNCSYTSGQNSTRATKQLQSNCVVWGDLDVLSFYGAVYSHTSKCSYTLTSTKINNIPFEVIFYRKPYSVKINYKSAYEITQTGSGTVFIKDGKSHSIPRDIDGISVSKPGSFVIINMPDLGFKIKWNTEDTIELISDNGPQPNGLCGNSNAYSNEWAIDGCKGTRKPNACSSGKRTRLTTAETFCKKLFADAKFSSCKDISPAFMDVCTSNYCKCTEKNANDCMCGLLDALVRSCTVNKGLDYINWRDGNMCRKRCISPEQEYLSCAPNKRQLSCGDENSMIEKDCEEGCYCPQGLYVFKDKCYFDDDCPCTYDNKEYPKQGKIKQDCNDCTCQRGQWNCTNRDCRVEGGCWGDPHCKTFDGKKFDFMGKCMYYVVRGFGFDIICDHYVRSGNTFVKDFQSNQPSLCRRVIIKSNDEEIELGQKHEVKVNGIKLAWLPRTVSGILINKPSSEFVWVTLENKVVVKFNGEARLSVSIPTSMKGRVRGLLGTYTNNVDDDFQLPDGTIVTNADVFGHAWKVPGSCSNEFTGTIPHPCVANPAMKPLAEKACSLLKSPTFAGCSKDPTEDYESCLMDACSCTDNPQQCACDPLAIQADICAQNGKYIEWRQSISECAIKCPAGQEYKVCGDSCTHSCDDIALNPKCEKSCIEGCSCPEGKTLNEKNVCVPIEECKCKLADSFYPPGFQYRTNKSLRTCTDAKWIEKVGVEGHESIPDIDTLSAKCKEHDFSEYTGCKATNPVTCQNMHKQQRPVFDNCEDGCQCIDGFVLDTGSNSCIRSDECPCLHNGISYEENAVRRNKNQLCTCKNSDWECVDEVQRWEKCSVWGNVHVRMFNGVQYSFQGYCEYILFQDITEARTIRITMTPCKCGFGSCVQHVKMIYISKGVEESIQFNRGAAPIITGQLNNLVLTTQEIMEVKDLGIKLIWHSNGFMHLHVKNSWKAKHQYGLCGSYNDDEVDEFITSEGTGVATMVNNWRLNKECPKAVELSAVDLMIPGHSCHALFDDVFSRCRAMIPAEEYYSRCLIEVSLQLLTGKGVQDYHCSSLSAYAQECSDLGEIVNWRKEEFCPAQCPKGSKYNQCVKDKDGVCYEGCEPSGNGGDGDEPTIIKLRCNDAKKPCKKTVQVNIEGGGVCTGNNQFTLVFNVNGEETIGGLVD